MRGFSHHAIRAVNLRFCLGLGNPNSLCFQPVALVVTEIIFLVFLRIGLRIELVGGSFFLALIQVSATGQSDFEMINVKKLIKKEIARHKPISEYPDWEDKEVVLNLVFLRALGRECVTRIIAQHGGDWKETFRLAYRIADYPNPHVLKKLYSICRDERPLRFLVWLRIEQEYIAIEFRRRLERTKAGWEITQLLKGLTPLESVGLLFRALEVDKITSYYPEEDSSEDLQQLAVEKALTYQERMAGVALAKCGFDQLQMISISLPSINIGLPVKDKEPWNQLNPRMLALQTREAIKLFLPVLQGNVEQMPELVYQALRDHWEKRKAQKRDAREVPYEEAEKEIVSTSYNELRDREVSREILNISARMSEVLKEAKKHKRWGDKAIKAFKYYCEGKTKKEASEMVGIDERTFRNNISRLNKIFTSKK